ncbi:Post-transcriptional regulator [Thermoactinomyces sp. DSM 45891]|uniref:post-transcriptional regulator n=1 Tax=Thermoactinomyces sp. DSM 45891 TaxID=1761907 RepID=UPI0009169CFE|nr:post-transcriptional regulator [Thermoactinomyces sp. DSM 45891]SFX08483.1 Post-transcriptional regulator [Thermoactinomyces sp. DSM 45891]
MSMLALPEQEYDFDEDEIQQLTSEELDECLEDLCRSKASEFHLYGYENVTPEQIWACVSDEHRQGTPRLNRLVNDIMSLKASRFMNWLMLHNIYKSE